MVERAKKVVVISPHHDDVAISLGSTISGRYKNVHLVNVFTRSDSTILDIDPEVEAITQLRANEDTTFASRYGYSAVNGGYPDSELRGIAWDDQQAEVDQELLNQISVWIKQQIDGINEPYDLFIPASFGLHPDHYITMIAALKTKPGELVYVYAEQPYFAGASGYHKGHAILTDEEMESYPSQGKREILSLYPSQLSDERIDQLVQINAEYYWQLSVEKQKIFLRLARLRNDQGEIRIFGDPDWIERIKESYASPDRTFLDISVPVLNGELLLPICMDIMDIPNVGKVRVARHASIYTSDYLVTGNEAVFDESSYLALRDAALDAGADLILLSNVRIGSAFYHCLNMQSNTCETASNLRNISSVGLVCESSYGDWYALQSKNMRRNIRRKMSKLADAAKETGSELNFELNRLDTVSLDTLLQNQKRRAGVTELDTYLDNLELVQFLESLVDIPNVQIAELKVGDETISSLLIIVEPEVRTIGIYLQSFSEGWEQYSPSFCAITKLIEHAHNNGFLYVDFLRGEEPYKASFVNHRVDMIKFLDQLNPNLDRNTVVNFFNGYEE